MTIQIVRREGRARIDGERKDGGRSPIRARALDSPAAQDRLDATGVRMASRADYVISFME
jgi:hypothetical protein